MFKFASIALATLTLAAAPAAFAKECAGPPAPAPHAAKATASRGDVVDVAIAAGSFKTLAKALTAADLVTVLKGQGPFTVFAPTDAAFAGLPHGELARLLKPENKAELVKILTYHVVPGRVLAADLSGKVTEAKTVEGETLTIDARQGVSVDNARVTKADVAADNGVIHVIDRVLLPKS
ncbi:MAG: fasciclin domain-containing protein [Alphaproteobacteria bacterium]|nr:fasciclin domain-containing protein [Alphaproteobacteria bacterium]